MVRYTRFQDRKMTGLLAENFKRKFKTQRLHNRVAAELNLDDHGADQLCHLVSHRNSKKKQHFSNTK